MAKQREIAEPVGGRSRVASAWGPVAIHNTEFTDPLEIFMNSFLGSRLPVLTLFAASLALTACGGSGSGDSSTGSGASPTTPPTSSPGTPPTTATATTPGVWKGSIVSTTSGQTASVVALTGLDGHSVWMTTDGRVWGGQMPMTGDHFDTTFSGHMYDGVHFPDGTNHGTTSMMIDRLDTIVTSGRYWATGTRAPST